MTLSGFPSAGANVTKFPRITRCRSRCSVCKLATALKNYAREIAAGRLFRIHFIPTLYFGNVIATAKLSMELEVR